MFFQASVYAKRIHEFEQKNKTPERGQNLQKFLKTLTRAPNQAFHLGQGDQRSCMKPCFNISFANKYINIYAYLFSYMYVYICVYKSYTQIFKQSCVKW